MDAQPDRGFTLIEMIVVLVVLALVVTLVLARGPMHSATIDLRACARTMAADMRATRAQAIATDRTLVYTVDLSHRDYGQRGGIRHLLPNAISITAPTAPITFHPDGSASRGMIVLTESDRHLGIRVDWLTGLVSVQ